LQVSALGQRRKWVTVRVMSAKRWIVLQNSD
jgi:hypothetical protein